MHTSKFDPVEPDFPLYNEADLVYGDCEDLVQLVIDWRGTAEPYFKSRNDREIFVSTLDAVLALARAALSEAQHDTGIDAAILLHNAALKLLNNMVELYLDQGPVGHEYLDLGRSLVTSQEVCK